MLQAHKSLQGHLLLDGGKLQGSFFQKTVVLICQHDTEGAFGLILNRATTSKVGQALVANLPEAIKQQPLFLGGPVQPQTLSFLHSDQFLPDANVMHDLNLGHSLDALMDLGESFSGTRKLKLFAGYAGWAAGQLDERDGAQRLARPSRLVGFGFLRRARQLVAGDRAAKGPQNSPAG